MLNFADAVRRVGSAVTNRFLGCNDRPVRPYLELEALPSEIVLVRRSAIEAVRCNMNAPDLIDEICEFVWTMLKGLYRHNELVEKAMQAHHANRYRSQVGEDSHEAYIYATKSDAAFGWSYALGGLEASGAGMQADVLKEMIALVRSNPDLIDDTADRDDGLCDDLAKLDAAFSAEEQRSPLTRIFNRWIIEWPELRFVEDGGYERAVNRLVSMNPNRSERLVARRIASFQHQIDDWLHVSIGMAAAAAPEPEIRLAIHAGGLVASENGERIMVWGLHTDKGRRFARVTESGASLHERIDTEDDWCSRPTGIEAVLKELRQMPTIPSRPPRVGACVSSVDDRQIKDVVRFANRVHAAAAIDLLLRRAGYLKETDSLSAVALSSDAAGIATLKWILAIGNDPYFVLTSENGAALIQPGATEATVAVSAEEIASHAEDYRDADRP